MANHHNAQVEYGGKPKTFIAYLVGFLLSITLTLFAFGLVEWHVLSDTYLYVALISLAVTQLFVQSICFLRLNNSAEGQWNLLPFLFVIMIIMIMLSGTIWIMYYLNYNMLS
jgi:cytochrome o ubiquinol oxidase operon protein cyoD